MTIRTNIKDLNKRFELLINERRDVEWIYFLFADDPEPKPVVGVDLIYILSLNRPKGYLGDACNCNLDDYELDWVGIN